MQVPTLIFFYNFSSNAFHIDPVCNKYIQYEYLN